MRVENLSLRQVSIAIPVLALINWAWLHFAVLPSMTGDQRRRLYSGWGSTPYPYALSVAFICFAIWFVFSYRGKFATRGRKIGVFAMALGSLCAFAHKRSI